MATKAIQLSKTQQVKLIKEAYAELSYLNLQDGFKDVAEYLFDKNLTAERQHRKGAPYGIKHGISANDAAKLFTVQHLLEGWQDPDKWTVDHILNIRSEVLYAQAYAKRFHNELTEWATKYASVKQVDYAELMKA